MPHYKIEQNVQNYLAKDMAHKEKVDVTGNIPVVIQDDITE